MLNTFNFCFAELQDYTIDNELYKFGVKDQTAKLNTPFIRQALQEKPKDEKEYFDLLLEVIINLPFDISQYGFMTSTTETSNSDVNLWSQLCHSDLW